MKYLAQILLLGGVLFCFSSGVFAATSVSISNVPPSIDKEQEVEIDVFLTCTGCSSDSYLRGAFYPSGTSYFGFTQNKDGVWTNASGSNCIEYYKVLSSELVEGSWSGKLKVKPDSSSSYYVGPGEYLFKIGRYTSSCSSPIWSQEITLAITGPSPTSTPAPTQSPTPSATTAPAASTSTPTKTPTPTKKTTPTSTPMDAPEPSDSSDAEPTSMVLGDTSQPTESSPSGSPMRALGVAAALVAAGLALIAGVLIWQKRNAMKSRDDILK